MAKFVFLGGFMDKNVFLLMPRKKHYAMGRKNLKFGSSNGDSLKSEVCYVWGSEQNDAGDSWPDFFFIFDMP